MPLKLIIIVFFFGGCNQSGRMEPTKGEIEQKITEMHERKDFERLDNRGF